MDYNGYILSIDLERTSLTSSYLIDLSWMEKYLTIFLSNYKIVSKIVI